MLDNLGQTTTSLVFAGNGIDMNTLSSAGTFTQPSSSLLRAESTTSYDDQGRTYSQSQYRVDQSTGTVGAAIISSMLYDARSQTVSQTDPLSRTISYAFDGAGRQTEMIQIDPVTDGSDGNTNTADYSKLVTYTTYDGNGNELTMTDALGNVTTFTYDAINRQAAVTGAAPDSSAPTVRPLTSYAYNATGWLDSVTDPLNRTTSYAYDNLGRKISTTLPDPDGTGVGHPLTSPVYLTSFDGNGNVLTTTDALLNVTTSVYDIFDHLITVAEGFGDVAAIDFVNNQDVIRRGVLRSCD